MRFLVDAQLPPALCRWLEALGHQAVHVSDPLPGAAADEAIAALVAKDGFVLISKDEDFVRLRLPDRFALLWLRCGNASNRTLTKWLEARWPEIERLLVSGERFVEVQ